MNRVFRRLDEVYAIGPEPGANRPGLSREEQQACALAREWMVETGMTVEWDPAGNLIGRRIGRSPGLPEVWIGSHLDSVPRGGRFDGVLGVAGAVEAVAGLVDESLERTVAAIAFRDEESYRFGVDYYGSRAAVGALAAEELERADADGVSLRAALCALGFDPPPTGSWLRPRPHCYLELHVEQGPVLAGAGCPLGLVDAIVGMAPLSVAFTGEAGHAGTQPMHGRRDALVAAARFIDQLRIAGLAAGDATVTVGQIACEPNAANVIPRRVELNVDLRSAGADTLEALVARARSEAARIAAAEGCKATVERRPATGPAAMNGSAHVALSAALREAGVPHVALSSGAGHDAAVLASAGVPTAMLFVRSLAGGVSHSPQEYSDPNDVALAVDVLRRAIRRLAGQPARRSL
jgi:allantoate deiminase